MSVELVTGYYGVGEDGKPKRHVSSAEDGARQAGTLGLGCYALSTGSKLSATMEDANTLIVADGDAMMNGRHVSLPDPTSFTIPTGVQGQKVSNLAVLRYQKAADSVESVTPLVLTGEPSAGTPTDPAYNEGSILDGDSPVDFPLYRVVTDGINAGDPVPLFDVMMPMSDLWGTASQTVADNVMVSRIGSAAVVSVDYIASSKAGSSTKIGTLPEGMRAVPRLGSDGGVYIAPLGYRGDASVRYGYLAVYPGTGNIFIWTKTAGASEQYYFGQLVVPLLR